jgi:protein-tyrosine phosphatase
MSEIPYEGAGNLYVAGIQEAAERTTDDLDRVITVCQDCIEDTVPDAVAYSWYEMSDGPHNPYGGDCSYETFTAAADELWCALSNGESVLIHCHEGQSRSVSVAAAALARLLGLRREQAVKLVRRYRVTDHYPDQLLIEHADEYINRKSTQTTYLDEVTQ